MKYREGKTRYRFLNAQLASDIEGRNIGGLVRPFFGNTPLHTVRIICYHTRATFLGLFLSNYPPLSAGWPSKIPVL